MKRIDQAEKGGIFLRKQNSWHIVDLIKCEALISRIDAIQENSGSSASFIRSRSRFGTKYQFNLKSCLNIQVLFDWTKMKKHTV